MSPIDVLKTRPPMPWWVELLVAALLTGGMAIWMQASHDDKALGERVSVTETQQKSTDKRLDRIEDKIDHLIEGTLGERPKRTRE